MHTIGITGGIGSGKSTVLAHLETEYGAAIMQADQIGRELMEPGAPCYAPVVTLFGPDCVRADGTLDRAWIRERIHADDALLAAQNAIIHPAVRAEILRRIDAADEAGIQWLFLEAALLIEGGYGEICEELWYVYADEDVRIRRLLEDRGMTEEAARAVMADQLDDAAFRAHCAFVIDNSGSFAETVRQIREKMEGYEQ